ncbi:MAG: GTP-binding protein [Promethearchaeota archaeon]|nr:MAG: GTP-binding protein [Candidatus Lokiarchaeota archaeon]
MSEIQKYSFKITVIGDGSVGKTSLITKFTKGGFQKEYIKTIGAQFSIYDKEIDGDQIRLIFWDIAGQEDFNFLRPSFYRESRAAIIVYSLEENDLGKRSFKNITNWHEDIKKFCGEIPITIFANKVDLIDEKNLKTNKIENLVKTRNFLGYCITSAKTGQGVIDAFNILIEELYYKSKALSSAS